MNWPTGKFSVIYADPPWSYYGDPTKDQACGKHYACMTDEELAGLPVRDLCCDDSVVLVWATCPRLDSAIRLISAWGLQYRGIPFIWVKTSKDGKIINGQGVRPTITKPTCELLLAGSINKRGRPLPVLNESMGQVVLAPRGRHSEKPHVVRDKIVGIFGDVPRIELFSRHQCDGWHSWGNEVLPKLAV